MRRVVITLFAIVIIALAVRAGAAESTEVCLVRTLPQAYVPGRTITVFLEAADYDVPAVHYPIGVYETIPEGWSMIYPSPSGGNFDAATRRIHWRMDSCWIEYCSIGISYDITPGEQTGEASFDGYCEYTAELFGPRVRAATIGDTTIASRAGMHRLVPQQYPTIQAAIDASLFGDTVVISPADGPYGGHIQMKQGVDLLGFPGSSAPLVQGAIKTAPHTTVRGIHLPGFGISAERGVAISNCLITDVRSAAIWFHDSPGRVTNCTIVRSVYGVYAFPGVEVINCVFRNNGSTELIPPFPRDGWADVKGAHVTFSCLQDQIYQGSGERNIYADPMFVNPAEGDYRLLPNSPCIDAGDNSAVDTGDTDLLGNPRIMSGGKSQTVDIGACEYWHIWPARQPGSGNLELRWSSRPERTYSVFFSEDLKLWHLADDNVPSGGNMTLWLDAVGWPPTVPTRFYRIVEND